MKNSLYIETSVLGYMVARNSKNVVAAARQKSTREFWRLLSGELVPHISALVLNEAGKGDKLAARKRLDAVGNFAVIAVTEEAERLAEAILAGRGTPAEYPEDALHIAIASVAKINFIVTWNFAHINNPFTKQIIRRIVETNGYQLPEIVSPEAFLGDST